MFRFLFLLAIAEVAFALPTNQTYDVSVESPTVKIVGGHAVNIADYPWQISLQYRNQHFCGGFLISSRWVVTAAHCIVEGYSTNLNIRAGSASTTTGGQSILVQGYIVHPGYTVYSYDHDIALLYLATAVTVANARAAILPVAGQELPDQLPVVVTGWGATREGGLGSAALLGVSVPTVNFNTCRNVYGTSLTANMFCAGYLGVGGRDACQGDSGGPAANNGVVVGVVSWGAGCASPLFPGVYVKVSNYRTWITQNTGI